MTVPTAYAAFPYDLGGRQPIELSRQQYNITQYSLFDDGGHFAAFESPKVLAEDIFKFAKKMGL